MTNRPLDRIEIETLKILAIKLNRRSSDWLGGVVFWNDVKRNVDAMLTTGTNDGEDIVEELTDEDAKQRPWVMGSMNDYAYSGPYKLLSGPPTTKRYVCIDEAEISNQWNHTRPLTPEEKARYSK